MDVELFDKDFPATQNMFDAPTETATDPIPLLYQSGYLTNEAPRRRASGYHLI